MFVRADNVSGAKSLLLRREERKDRAFVPPLRLNGRVGAKHQARTFKLADYLQPDNCLACTRRGDKVHLTFAVCQFLLNQVQNLQLIFAQWKLEMQRLQQRLSNIVQRVFAGSQIVFADASC